MLYYTRGWKNGEGKKYNLQQVGNNIKSIRTAQGLTQEQMAEKLNRSVNFVSLIELGKSGMSVPTIIEICNVLDVDTNSIFKGLIPYKQKEKDRYIVENISAFNDKDKKIVTDLMKYILETREC